MSVFHFFSSRTGEISMLMIFGVCLSVLLYCVCKFSVQANLWYMSFIVELLPESFI